MTALIPSAAMAGPEAKASRQPRLPQPQRRAVRVDGLVAQLAGCAADAQMQLTVDHQPAADPGADGEAGHGVHPAACAKAPFAIGDGAGVVEQENRQPGLLAMVGCRGTLGQVPGRLGRKTTSPCSRSSTPGTPMPTPWMAELLSPALETIERMRSPYAPSPRRDLHVPGWVRIGAPSTAAAFRVHDAGSQVGATQVNADE